MSDPRREAAADMSLKDYRMTLPKEVQALMPEGNLSYYEQTNEMHCGDGLGGSKFENAANIFEVVAQYPDLAQRVADRTDDRKALLEAGAPEAAFLPATKSEGMPEGLPEALYYKIDGVEGRLGIIGLAELDPEDKVLVMREKGMSDEEAEGYAPVSFTVMRESADELPKTDYATAIFGREGGDTGQDELWTVHPGPPIRPAMKELDWTRDLKSPQELDEGEKQKAKVVTVAELLESAEMSSDDYIKISQGDLDATLEDYEVV